MSQSNFEVLINKVLTDEAFAKSLAEAPQSALKSIGVEPTPEIIDAIKNVDAGSFKQLASAFGDDRAAA